MAVRIDVHGEVCCPGCGDRFQVESSPSTRPSGPCCPKCGAVLSMKTVMAETSGIGWVGQERMLYCPHCLAILGFTAWKR